MITQKLTDANVHLTQKEKKKSLHKNIQNNICPNIWALWPGQVDT